MNDADHDREFWFPCQPSRGEAIVVVGCMVGIVMLAASAIVAAVV